MGATAEGHQELLAVQDGYRESMQSWRSPRAIGVCNHRNRIKLSVETPICVKSGRKRRRHRNVCIGVQPISVWVRSNADRGYNYVGELTPEGQLRKQEPRFWRLMRSSEMICEHEKALEPMPARTPKGCEECLRIGAAWVHLRLCLTCGHVGCCDSSPGQHATRHAHRESHPVMASYEPGERWAWCYVDDAMVDLPEAAIPYLR